MGFYGTIARPYAKAVFLEAKSDFESWSILLRALEYVATDLKIRLLLNNPSIDKIVMKELVCGVLELVIPDTVTKLNPKLKNFISLLINEKRLSAAGDISFFYHQLLAKYENLVKFKVVSSASLDESQKIALHSALKKRFSSNVSIEFFEDKRLIGGVLIHSGHWVLDGSIRGKIARLSEILTA